MNNIIVPSLVAAVVMFIWGSVFWMSPLPYSSTMPVADQAQAQTQLATIFPKSGTYLLPSLMVEGVDQEAVTALFEKGPNVIAQVTPGRAAFDPIIFAKGLIHYFIAAMLLAFLMLQMADKLTSFGDGVKFSAKVALIMVFFSHGSELIWWGAPKGWLLWTAFYEFVAIVIAGAVLSKMLKLSANT